MKNTIMSAQPYGQPRASSYLRTIWPGGSQNAGDAGMQLLCITVVCTYRYQSLMTILSACPLSTRFSLSVEMSRLTRDGTTVEPVSRDQILRRERGQGKNSFPCSADHEQDWQPYPVDPYHR